MKKTKSLKNLILILGAVLSIVFVCAFNSTFASAAIQIEYQTNFNKTTAYLKNQQYVVVNDTVNAPIDYSIGAHSTSVALQYSIAYDFDLRIKYSLSWSDSSLSTSNVELLFANRDNVIIDENYIYYINYKSNQPSGLSAGDGKIMLISGVEIIDHGNPDYMGSALTINIDEVKISKQSETYSDSHVLYDAGEAGRAWLQHKNSSSITNAYVMMYNYRYSRDVGVTYPGHNSAYSKQISGSYLETATWIGGNRAYAGVGMYVITGESPFEVKAKVAGTWRKADGSGNIQQFDNNIRFNYAENWINPVLDSNKLFETREFSYVIPANSACYITIVDSVEITCAELIDISGYNSQMAVVNEIVVNDVIFSYDGNNLNGGDAKVLSAVINTVDVAATEDYAAKSITAINSSKYSNSLYEYKISSPAEQNFYNSTILLINNTNTKQKVILNLGLNYYVSNGATALTLADGSRASSFADHAYFRFDGNVSDTNINVQNNQEFVLEPYSSYDVNCVYSVGADFQSEIDAAVGAYDAWLELNANFTNNETTDNANLILEINNQNSRIALKNNTNETITSAKVTVSLKGYYLSINEEAAATCPADWLASYWKYYSVDADGEMIQNTSTNWNPMVSYYKSENVSKAINLTPLFGGTYSEGVYLSGAISLKPNESMDILSFNILGDVQFIMEGKAEIIASSACEDLVLISSGVNQKYIINNSLNSYYVRFNGIIPHDEIFDNVITETDGFNYFITIVRPGQILDVASTASAIGVIEAEDEFVHGEDGSLSDWITEDYKLPDVLQAFKIYFNVD